MIPCSFLVLSVFPYYISLSKTKLIPEHHLDSIRYALWGVALVQLVCKYSHETLNSVSEVKRHFLYAENISKCPRLKP